MEFEIIYYDFENLNNKVLGEGNKVFLAKRNHYMLVKHYFPAFKEVYLVKILLQHCLWTNLVDKLIDWALSILWVWFCTLMGRQDNFLQTCILLLVC